MIKPIIISAPNKRVIRKKQQIQSVMNDLYKERSPNSKILKYLFSNERVFSPKPIKSIQIPSKHVSTVIIGSDDGPVISMVKGFTIEGPEIDEIYEKSSEKLKKRQLSIKRLDNVLYETLQKKQQNPLSFSENLKREMRRFFAKSVEIFKNEEEEKNEENIIINRKTQDFKAKKFQKNLPESIKRRVVQKNPSSTGIYHENPYDFVKIYREIKKKNDEQTIKNDENQENHDNFEINDNNDDEKQKSSPKTSPHSMNIKKRLEKLEQRKAFEQSLKESKGKLLEKINILSEDSKKKARTEHEFLTTIDKIKRKYEFLQPKPKKQREMEEIALVLENMKQSIHRKKKENSFYNNKNIFNMTFNQKVRLLLNNRGSHIIQNMEKNRKSTKFEKSDTFCKIHENTEFMRKSASSLKKYDDHNRNCRDCDDLMHLKPEKERKIRSISSKGFVENYQNLKKKYPIERKSHGLFKEMNKGFAEVERKLKSFKTLLSDYPESLNIDIKD